jgi:cadmium resistance protein CadD (predicted permease)
MNSMLTIIPVAAAAYIATNLDNLALLVTLLARHRNQTGFVAGGYLVCMMILGFAGFWIGAAAGTAPVEYLGLLGLVPVSIGVMELVRLRRGKTNEATSEVALVDGGRSVFMATLISQIGNGADTLITFGALFADSMPGGDVLIVLTLAAMAVIFLLIALYGVRHPALQHWIHRHAPHLTPYILIVVGLYILANTATDLLPN